MSKSAASAETMKRFHSDMKLLPDGVIHVKESFDIDFKKHRYRNQVIRYVQTRYHREGKIHDVQVHLKRVMMDNSPETHAIVRTGTDEIQIHVGSEDKPLINKHSFLIEYEVFRAVNFIRGRPELFINISGDHWPFPVRNISCDLQLPKGVDLGQDSLSAWSLVGAPGHYTSKLASASKGSSNGFSVLQFAAKRLDSGQGLYALVDLPPGSIILPSSLHDFVWYIGHSAQIILLPLGTCLALVIWWGLTGRGQKTTRKVEEGWKPPEYLTPCEVGTLFDESCDLSDIVSTIVDLAARGFITIRVLPYNGFLYLSNRDYELCLVKSPKDKELKPHEKVFLALLFGFSSTTYVSSLKGQFEQFLPLIRRYVYESLVTGGYFTRDPEFDRRNFIAVGCLVMTLGLSFLFVTAHQASASNTAVGVILSGLVIILASGAMPRRSSLGTVALKQTINFRNFLAHGEKSKVESIVGKDPEEFGKYLSYAIALGVTDRYARVFRDVVKQYPQWYQIDESLTRKKFTSQNFIKELGDGLTIINRALTEKGVDSGSISRSKLDELVDRQFRTLN